MSLVTKMETHVVMNMVTAKNFRPHHIWLAQLSKLLLAILLNPSLRTGKIVCLW